MPVSTQAASVSSCLPACLPAHRRLFYSFMTWSSSYMEASSATKPAHDVGGELKGIRNEKGGGWLSTFILYGQTKALSTLLRSWGGNFNECSRSGRFHDRTFHTASTISPVYFMCPLPCRGAAVIPLAAPPPAAALLCPPRQPLRNQEFGAEVIGWTIPESAPFSIPATVHTRKATNNSGPGQQAQQKAVSKKLCHRHQ